MTSFQPSGSNPSGPHAAFGRLHRSVQSWIWEQKWEHLRPTQAEAVDPILRGDTDVIISAATASGKTEAAWLPILSSLADARDKAALPSGVKALYVSPLKALINDQYGRLETLASKVGMPIHRRHGDVGGSARRALKESPEGLLLITPESLEAMFVTQGTRVSALLNGLQYVVIDELHSFIGTERGAQLQSLLHRVELTIRRTVPRIGLSATLSNPSIAARFLRPDKEDSVQVIGGHDDDTAELRMQLRGYITSGGSLSDREDHTDFAPDKQAIADHLFRNLRGQDNLVFANSRANVEIYADLLKGISDRARLGNEFFPHHGNLSKEFREDVESRLRSSGTPTTAVCTSTLEMGIDIGSADTVAQIGAPGSVSALRQRLGRSGRRGKPATLRLYVSERPVDHRTPPVDQLRAELFEAIATVELLLEKWYEPPNTDGLHLSTLIQQTLSVIAQHGGATAAELYSALCKAGPFSHVDQPMFIQLLRSLGTKDIIMQSSEGILLPGAKGERLINHYSFYSAFHTAEEYRLVSSGRTLGSIPIDQPLVEGGLLIFAGRRWRILDVDTAAKVINLTKAGGGLPPSFSGSGIEISDGIRQRMKQLYESSHVPVYLDSTARTLFEEGRAAYSRLGLRKTPLLVWGDDTLLFPWAGDRIMNTLHVLLSGQKYESTLDGAGMTLRKTSLEEAATLLGDLASNPPPDPSHVARSVVVKERDKNDVYLDDQLLTRSYAAAALDVAGTWPALRQLAAATAEFASESETSRRARNPNIDPAQKLARTGPYAVIDVETTGFSPRRDRIVEIAIVHVSEQGTVHDVWSTLINPEQATGPSHIHGITNTDVRTAPRFEDVLPAIQRQLAGRTIVAHNATFDLGFLNSEFQRAGATVPVGPSLCTMQLTRRYFPGQSAVLSDVCKRLDIKTGEAHTAASDALAAARILSLYVMAEV
ncbi:exonuclease domain-containing protein [Arthrobacter koreensis]|uniref:Exonuclease domain-containing protein n=1 Tax=Arthrobacter koreensis TaxID=199136 RepID=A0ABY6FT36_9MICC|nr:DEAD/DEAH box helicase [Arthrobacter koreensis]UYB36357.1 exonuclease domain-containing protein [Arthrobacter koreensis]